MTDQDPNEMQQLRAERDEWQSRFTALDQLTTSRIDTLWREQQRLVSRLRALVKTMRSNATALKIEKDYANPELQPARNASAHSMEFWALRIEEELAANDLSSVTAGAPLVETGSSRRVSLTDERDDAELTTAQQTIARLRSALCEYGEHQGVCPKKYHGMKDARPCTCGLDAALTTSAQ